MKKVGFFEKFKFKKRVISKLNSRLIKGGRSLKFPWEDNPGYTMEDGDSCHTCYSCD